MRIGAKGIVIRMRERGCEGKKEKQILVRMWKKMECVGARVKYSNCGSSMAILKIMV